jgi:hypothetical protein
LDLGPAGRSGVKGFEQVMAANAQRTFYGARLSDAITNASRYVGMTV